MTIHSILVPFMPQQPQSLLPFAALVQYGRPHRLWTGQSLQLDGHHAFSYLAGAGLRVPVGTGVSLMPLRHPYEAAVQAHSMALATGEAVVAGFGPGAVQFQELMMGAPYRSQLGAVREYVTIVRDLLRDGVSRRSGEFFSCRADLWTVRSAEVEVGLGVLRPGMARLAGELADVAITWLTPPRYLAEVVVPALEAGAVAAGRPRPRLVAVVPLALDGPDRDPVEVVLAGSRFHLSAPHYQDMLRRSGVEVDVDDVRRTAKGVLAHEGFLFGDEAAVAAGLGRYAAAGVDEVVLNLTGTAQLHGPQVALHDAQAVLGAVTP